MEKAIEPFEFKHCISILKSTGRNARNLHELRDLIARVSDESIYYHTYQYFMKGHMLEYTNDFSYWVGEALGEKVLEEYLSDIDPYALNNVKSIRNKLLDVIDAFIESFPLQREVLPGDEFYFNEAITISYPMGIRANNLAEFLIAIKYIDAGSMYYHFYEARTHVRGGTSEFSDDFSWWFGVIYGKDKLAEKIKAIDPFMHTIESIREHLIEAVEEAVRLDMEGL
ncbi:MAG: DUF5752 family protein [Dissulfurispiraceae bacterium]|jgi:hypothetical protein